MKQLSMKFESFQTPDNKHEGAYDVKFSMHPRVTIGSIARVMHDCLTYQILGANAPSGPFALANEELILKDQIVFIVDEKVWSDYEFVVVITRNDFVMISRKNLECA